MMQNLGERKALWAGVVLICGDMAFVVLHTLYRFSPLITDRLFSIELDGGYSEVYQYFKWICIAAVFSYLAVIKRSSGFASWALVFWYLLCDDAFQFHERFGNLFDQWFNFVPPFGLRVQDFGEFTLSAVVGTFLLFIMVSAYRKGSGDFKNISKDMLKLILLLVFFGVVVDGVHVIFQSYWKTDFIFGVIEDGGEMLVASLMLWYVLRLPKIYGHKT